MSAFVLDDTSINQLANSITFYAEYGRHHVWQTKSECQSLLSMLKMPFSSQHGFIDQKTAVGCTAKIAQILYALNVDAVNQRYNDNESIMYDGFRSTPPLKPIEFLKKLHCWQYQCSEGNVPDRKFFKAIEKLSAAASHDIVVNSKEYEAASWG